jgi:hypothetical protein
VASSFPDPSNLNFERRIIMREDVGRAFQQFVWEALSQSDFAGGTLVQHPVRGVDGGIDLIQEKGGRRTILECKFHGDRRTDSVESDWKKIAKILRNTLPALLAGEKAAILRSPHGPWLDRERPVTAYWFCTSASLPNQAALDRVVRKIREDLAAIAELAPGLSHLRDVHVEVRSAQHFAGTLAKLARLRFRWFGGLPHGLTAIGAYSTSTRTFRKFLQGGCLPYFSFGEFTRETNAVSDFLPDPEHLLDRLIEDSRPALIISGRGGIGKTRLGLEVAVAAERRGIVSLACGQQVDGAAIESLAREHIDTATCLIFIDYAEAHPNLTAIGGAIEAVNAVGHRLRLIATCRSSGERTVEHALEELGTRSVVLDDEKDGTTTRPYVDWVVDRILAHGNLKNVPGLSKVCAGLPVLATFALHLSQSQPGNFERFFGGLTTEMSFEQWASRRIEIMLKALGSIRDQSLRRMAEVAAILPLSPAEGTKLRAASSATSAILDILIADGWVDEEGGSINAAHDVFADAILANYLFASQISSQMRALDVLTEAHSWNALGRAVASVDRLAGHPGFTKLDGLGLIRSLSQSDADAASSIVLEILRSPLFRPEDVLALVREDERVRERLCSSYTHEGGLLYFIKEILRGGEDGLRKQAAEDLRPTLEARLSLDNQPTNMLLGRAFLLDPLTFSDRALEEMKRNPQEHQTHYLIRAWLSSKLPPQKISSIVTCWLDAHSRHNVKCSFVFRAWLQAHGDIDVVRPHVHRWLERYFEIPEAEFIYCAWLQAGGEKDEIFTSLAAWMEMHWHRIDAGYVYSHWLNSAGDWSTVASYVRRWLDLHGRSVHATQVIVPWLRARAPLDLIADDIQRWLARNCTHVDASHVYGLWLREVGQGDPTEDYVLRWITIHGTAKEAGRVYCAWLSARWDISNVGDAIRRWIDLYADLPQTSYVFSAWLEAELPAADIAPALRRWLDIHSSEPVARHGLCTWLRGDLGLDEIAPLVRQWLRLHVRDPDAQYLIKYISRQPNLSLEIAAGVAAWCQLNVEDPEAVTRIRTALVQHGRGDGRPVLQDIALDILERLDPEDFEERGINVAALSVIGLVGWSLHYHGESNTHAGRRLAAVHQYLMCASNIYKPDQVADHPRWTRQLALINHVAYLVRAGYLNRVLDKPAIENFIQWIAAWPAEEQRRAFGAVERLGKALYQPTLCQRLGMVAPRDDQGENRVADRRTE